MIFLNARSSAFIIRRKSLLNGAGELGMASSPLKCRGARPAVWSLAASKPIRTYCIENWRVLTPGYVLKVHGSSARHRCAERPQGGLDTNMKIDGLAWRGAHTKNPTLGFKVLARVASDFHHEFIKSCYFYLAREKARLLSRTPFVLNRRNQSLLSHSPFGLKEKRTIIS